mgnify:CR=1 FL=1
MQAAMHSTSSRVNFPSEVVLPAFSEAEGSKELAGVLLAAWSAASGVGGLIWGARGGNAPLLKAHMLFAWLSLFSVGLTDAYIRLCSMGVLSDMRLF